MKKFLTAITAILMLSALTACGNDKNSAEVTSETTSAVVLNENPAETQTENNNTTEAETKAETKAAASQDENSAETQAENNDETEAEAKTETEAETEAAKVDDKDLYSGNGYTIKADSAKWMDASEYVKLISEYAENTNLTSLTAEELQNLNDGMFYHTNQDGTNFNIVTNHIGNTYGVKIGDTADAMKIQYEAAGINWIDSKVVEINGLEWLEIEVKTSMSGTDMKMLQCMALSDGEQYVITYTADTDKYNNALSDFEEVLNSFKLTK